MLNFKSQIFKRFLAAKFFAAFTAPALILTLVSALTLAPQAMAGEVDVVQVKADKDRSGMWSFSVSLRHDDTGWDHYADNWEVLSPNGEILAERVLAHPHVDEQPFTRSLSDIKIPNGLTYVILRGRDGVHGYGGQTMRVDLLTGKAEIIPSASTLETAEP